MDNHLLHSRVRLLTAAPPHRRCTILYDSGQDVYHQCQLANTCYLLLYCLPEALLGHSPEPVC